ncbi:MAG: 50S ribosomal protein L20 [Holosporales bacterium]|jgi:large subunit ribosomal protein L20|nr:50S ribosomal protein L20 [Holosporales bacterium]
MARVKRGMTIRARHKKVLRMAKGYRGRANACFRIALEKVEKGLQYAYRDRRVKKRTFRGLWIQRINAAVRQEGMTYSSFMHGLHQAGVVLDRKVMAELAVHKPFEFKAVIEASKVGLAG